MTHAKASEIANLFQQHITQYPAIKRWFVALSGGLDSSVLLHLCHQAKLYETHQLSVVHVNHQLQDVASEWEAHCQQLCSELDVPLHIIRVDVDAAADGVENGARKARYQVFENLLEMGDGLLMAHHQDDQAETFMLRLMRGSGVKGLASIPTSRPLGRGCLVRPLLLIDRGSLEDYAAVHSLRWIEDPSNQSIEFDRNFLRQKVIPLLETRWPGASQQVARSARLCLQADLLNEDLAAMDLRSCSVMGIAGEGIGLDSLQQLSSRRQINVVRYWLSGEAKFLPNESVVDGWLSQFYSALPDTQPEVAWEGFNVRRYQNVIYRVGRVDLPVEDFVVEPESVYKNETGTFQSELLQGQGVRWHKGQELVVSFTPKMSKYYLAGRKGGRTLKKIFQEQQVPQWLRSQLPVLLVDGQPAALLGFVHGPLVLEGFQVAKDEKGLNPLWALPRSKRTNDLDCE